MQAVICLLALLFLVILPVRAGDSGVNLAPTYSAASIVNSATNREDALAPNTIVSLYGKNLSWTTRAMGPGDIGNGMLPNVLAGTGVWVLISNIPAQMYYVSPTQVNFLIPNNLRPGRTKLQLVRDGWAGPAVEIRLRDVAPALYQLDPETAIAARPDGSVATSEKPAHPGDVVILYATGLGPTVPPFPPGRIPDRAAKLDSETGLDVLLDGSFVTRANILYAGVTPGFAGLYQVNLRLPATVGDFPEVRLLLDGEASPRGVHLPVVR